MVDSFTEFLYFIAGAFKSNKTIEIQYIYYLFLRNWVSLLTLLNYIDHFFAPR